MAGIFAHLPPHRLHTCESISADDTLKLLSEYIASAEGDASLQSNAILTETGPTSATQGPGVGLTIHNLKRIEAGLRGEHLGADLSFAKLSDEELPDLQSAGDAAARQEKKRRQSEAAEVQMGTGGWQEREEYERQQEGENIQEADLGDRLPDVADGEEARRNRTVAETSTPADKEARKKAKKERSKAEKKEREKKRQSAKDD